VNRDFHDVGLLCEVGWVDCEGEGVGACCEEGVVSVEVRWMEDQVAQRVRVSEN
jgi:hypothetical protein